MASMIVLNRAQMGDGDATLGQIILQNFLRKLPALEDVETIAFYNAGVHLAINDSPVAVELRQLHENGVDLLVCGTCVERYGVRERLIVKPPSSMDDILAAMKKADKVITL